MIRTILGAILIASGVLTMVVATIGIFRFKYVLSRMQAAALVDTLGILLLLTGLAVLSGFSVLSAKTVLIIVFLWLASPVTSHLIAKTEVMTNPDIKKECEVTDHDDHL